jgi:hypothetical protein
MSRKVVSNSLNQGLRNPNKLVQAMSLNGLSSILVHPKKVGWELGETSTAILRGLEGGQGTGKGATAIGISLGGGDGEGHGHVRRRQCSRDPAALLRLGDFETSAFGLFQVGIPHLTTTC